METIRINRLMLAAVAILVALTCWMGWGLWQSTDTEAHSIGWKWDTSSRPVVSNYTTPYGAAIASAVDDYHRNTDLSLNTCNSPCRESVRHTQVSVGNVDWAGLADSYSNGLKCLVSITCNETTNKVTYGIAVWNSAHGPYTDGFANYLARHEMGHIFGLAHVTCVTPEYQSAGFYSVMGVHCPYDALSVLQTHDIQDINAKY